MPDHPTVDVHAHYIPAAALELMGSGRAVVSTETVGERADCIALNGMLVGTTIEKITSVDSMLRAMDDCGVDRRVLSPPPFTYRYWADTADTLRLHRLLNDATARVVEQHPDRFSGLAIAPLQAPEVAIAELGRAKHELGLAGLTVGTNVDDGNLSDDGPVSVLAEAELLDLPILIHPDFVPNPRLGSHYLINLIGMPTETAIALGNLILSGTLERMPGLRVCVVHGGGSLPYLLGRLDKGWVVRPETRATTESMPSELLGNVFFDSLTHSPQALRYLIDLVGPERVVVGTDAPFDVEEPHPIERLRSAPGLTGAEEHTIARLSPRWWLHGHNEEYTA